MMEFLVGALITGARIVAQAMSRYNALLTVTWSQSPKLCSGASYTFLKDREVKQRDVFLYPASAIFASADRIESSYTAQGTSNVVYSRSSR